MHSSENYELRKKVRPEPGVNELTKEIEEMQLFMYAMIHDLKAPISNLNTIFSLIKKDELPEKDLLMEKAETVIHNMEHTIDKLNKLIILKDGKQEDLKKIDLNTLLEELKASDISDNLKSIDLSVNFEKCPTIFYPETYLKSILSNLVNNAIKYSSNKRPLHVYISSQKMGENVLLTVRDNGQGINIPKEGKYLFQPFKKLSNSKEGSRLGLFLIKNLIEKNHGHIIVDSTPDVGTTFTLYLKEYKS